MSHIAELSDELLSLIVDNLNPDPHTLAQSMVIDGIRRAVSDELKRRSEGPFYLAEVAATGRKFRRIGTNNGYIQACGTGWYCRGPSDLDSILGDLDIQLSCIRSAPDQFEAVFEYVEDEDE